MTVQIHGREYKTVAERINEIHEELKGELSVETKLISWEDGRIIIKATVTTAKGVFTGHAYEMEGNSQINRTSALENCETSAIGRALSSAGYGGSEFASANEVQNAVQQQTKKMTANVFASRLNQSKKAFESQGVVDVFYSFLESSYGTKDPVEVVKNHLDKAEAVIDGLLVAYREALA